MVKYSAIPCLFVAVTGAQAAIVTRSVMYHQADTTLEGFLAYDDALTDQRPGVLVVHEWWGLNDFAKNQARRLAQLGYIALAIDMYGKGVVTTDPTEAGRLASQFKDNPQLLRDRAAAGLETLAADPHVRPHSIAAIGFCFGGTTVLQLAYSGADLAGVVSFHGGLVPPQTADMERIKAKILVLHGAADTHVPPEQVATFQQTIERTGADWQMVIYGGAKHSFTNPDSDKLNMPGVGYQALAAERSWQQMLLFFGTLFKSGPDAGP
jgi:dienelactone hydrolase